MSRNVYHTTTRDRRGFKPLVITQSELQISAVLQSAILTIVINTKTHEESWLLIAVTPLDSYLKAVVHHILVSKSVLLHPCYLSFGTSHCLICCIYIFVLWDVTLLNLVYIYICLMGRHIV